jgi:hypothetical protein
MEKCFICGKEWANTKTTVLDWHHGSCVDMYISQLRSQLASAQSDLAPWTDSCHVAEKERDAALRMVEALQAVIEECRQMLYLDGYELGAYITATLIPSIRAAQSLTLESSLETLKREREAIKGMEKALEHYADCGLVKCGGGCCPENCKQMVAKQALEAYRKERGV